MLITREIPGAFVSYDSNNSLGDEAFLGAGCRRMGRYADMDADYDEENTGYDDCDQTLECEEDEWSDEPEEFPDAPVSDSDKSDEEDSK